MVERGVAVGHHHLGERNDEEDRQEEQDRELQHRPRLDVPHDATHLAGPHLRLARARGTAGSGSSSSFRRAGGTGPRGGCRVSRVASSAPARNRAVPPVSLGAGAPGWSRDIGASVGQPLPTTVAPSLTDRERALGLATGIAEHHHHPHVEALRPPRHQPGPVGGGHLACGGLPLDGTRQGGGIGRRAGRRPLLARPRQRHQREQHHHRQGHHRQHERHRLAGLPRPLPTVVVHDHLPSRARQRPSHDGGSGSRATLGGVVVARKDRARPRPRSGRRRGS